MNQPIWIKNSRAQKFIANIYCCKLKRRYAIASDYIFSLFLFVAIRYTIVARKKASEMWIRRISFSLLLRYTKFVVQNSEKKKIDCDCWAINSVNMSSKVEQKCLHRISNVCHIERKKKIWNRGKKSKNRVSVMIK
jgi:hypothetical protein